MNAEHINPFIASTVNVIKTMAQTNPVPGSPCVKQNSHTWGEVTGLIGMAGDDVQGNLLISFDKASILEIVNKMLSESFTDICGDVCDAVGEITNMISGGTKAALSEAGFSFNMASPIVISGKGIELTQLSKSPVISVPFETGAGKFVIEASLTKLK